MLSCFFSHFIFTDVLLLICIVIPFIIYIVTTRSDIKNMRCYENKEYLHPFLYLRKNWLNSSIAYLIAYHWATAISILCNILVVYLGISGVEGREIRIILYSSLGLFFAFLVLCINPKKMAYGYRKAFMEINKAIRVTSSTDESQAIGILNLAAIEGDMHISETQHDFVFVRFNPSLPEDENTSNKQI